MKARGHCKPNVVSYDGLIAALATDVLELTEEDSNADGDRSPLVSLEKAVLLFMESKGRSTTYQRIRVLVRASNTSILSCSKLLV